LTKSTHKNLRITEEYFLAQIEEKLRIIKLSSFM